MIARKDLRKAEYVERELQRFSQAQTHQEEEEEVSSSSLVVDQATRTKSKRGKGWEWLRS
jgi:hypothetical protein